MSDSENTNDQPITPNMLIKWGAILAAICTTLVSIIWFCASVKQEQAVQRDDLTQTQSQVTDLKARANNADQNLQDLNRKMDVANTLLTRIDSKVGKP